MAWKGKSKKRYSGLKMTGLFKTKRKGLYVGSLDVEKVGEAIKFMKAKGAENGITVFLWKSKYEDGPAFNLVIDEAQDRSERKPKRRIEEDDDDEQEEETEDDDEDEKDDDDDDPFGGD